MSGFSSDAVKVGRRDTGTSMAILLDRQNPLPFTEGLQLRAWVAFLTAPTVKELCPIQVQDSEYLVSELISWEGGTQDAYMCLCECTCVRGDLLGKRFVHILYMTQKT